MDTTTIDIYIVADVFLLLLIGIGPKIALVPYLELTADMDPEVRGKVTRSMLKTAAVVAGILVVFGEILRRLLHFSTGALSIAGGIILLIIAVTMIRGPREDEEPSLGETAKDPLQVAVFPLAVPYLLNPAGIVALVTLSADAVCSVCSRSSSAISRWCSRSTPPCFAGQTRSATDWTNHACSSPRRCSGSCSQRSLSNSPSTGSTTSASSP